MDQKTTGSGDSVRLSYLPSSTTPITSAKGPSTPPRKCLPTASGLCRIRLAKARLTMATCGDFVSSCQVNSRDRKSTRLNSSHVEISYAVFCLKKKKKK